MASSDCSLNVIHGRASRLVMQLNPNDVLMGRGAPFAYYEGNISFRELVLPRKQEYSAASSHQQKQVIAKELYEDVGRLNGRFLERMKPAESVLLGVPAGEKAWRIVDEDVALEKIKQALREKSASDESAPKPSSKSSRKPPPKPAPASRTKHPSIANNHGTVPVQNSVLAPVSESTLLQQSSRSDPNQFRSEIGRASFPSANLVAHAALPQLQSGLQDGERFAGAISIPPSLDAPSLAVLRPETTTPSLLQTNATATQHQLLSQIYQERQQLIRQRDQFMRQEQLFQQSSLLNRAQLPPSAGHATATTRAALPELSTSLDLASLYGLNSGNSAMSSDPFTFRHEQLLRRVQAEHQTNGRNAPFPFGVPTGMDPTLAALLLQGSSNSGNFQRMLDSHQSTIGPALGSATGRQLSGNNETSGFLMDAGVLATLLRHQGVAGLVPRAPTGFTMNPSAASLSHSSPSLDQLADRPPPTLPSLPPPNRGDSGPSAAVAATELLPANSSCDPHCASSHGTTDELTEDRKPRGRKRQTQPIHSAAPSSSSSSSASDSSMKAKSKKRRDSGSLR